MLDFADVAGVGGDSVWLGALRSVLLRSRRVHTVCFIGDREGFIDLRSHLLNHYQILILHMRAQLILEQNRLRTIRHSMPPVELLRKPRVGLRSRIVDGRWCAGWLTLLLVNVMD